MCRYVVGTLDLMVAENYVMVYLCAGGQKDKVPGISWLRECYTTINHRYTADLCTPLKPEWTRNQVLYQMFLDGSEM